MPLKTIGTGRGLMGSSTYAARVLNTGPLAYWPLWETSGTVAHCLVNPAQNGTYTSDVSTWPPGTGIGDGNSAPYFDGTNDAINVLTATLSGAYNGDEGTVMCWGKVSGAGVWGDGAVRYLTGFPYSLFNDHIALLKRNLANRLRGERYGGGVGITDDKAGVTTVDWFQYAITWSQVNNAVVTYLNTAGTTTAGPAAWTGGALTANTNCIGAGSIGPVVNAWQGWLAHAAIWTRPLSASAITGLYSV